MHICLIISWLCVQRYNFCRNPQNVLTLFCRNPQNVFICFCRNPQNVAWVLMNVFDFFVAWVLMNVFDFSPSSFGDLPLCHLWDSLYFCSRWSLSGDVTRSAAYFGRRQGLDSHHLYRYLSRRTFDSSLGSYHRASEAYPSGADGHSRYLRPFCLGTTYLL